MPATARKLALSDKPVDINEATATELREGLPGIGEVLAQRIVAYRDEHGPFAEPADLSLVPGLNEKRVLKLVPRISVVPPTSGFRVPAASSSPVANDFVTPMPIFSIESEPLPTAIAPSMTSLMPDGPMETMGGQSPASFAPILSDSPSSFESSFFDDSPSHEVGASLLSPAPQPIVSARPTQGPRTQIVDSPIAEDDLFPIPINRPLRIAVALAAIGVLSALVGATFGIKSQEGGPRGRLEQRVGLVESNVGALEGSVRSLQTQASAFASSINALDARLTEQAHKPPQPVVPAPAQAETPQKLQSSSEKSSPVVDRPLPEADVRIRVRQAMRELDSVVPSARTQ